MGKAESGHGSEHPPPRFDPLGLLLCVPPAEFRAQ
jgi:hypothetical protein